MIDDAHFTDALSNNFIPNDSNSPLVDGGINISHLGVQFDFNNEIRTDMDVFDIGAFEYQNSGGRTDPGNDNDKNNIRSLNIEVVPNPVIDTFAIQVDGYKFLNISLFSDSGDLIYSNAKYKVGDPINISSIADGVYFLRVDISTTDSSFIKLIKE